MADDAFAAWVPFYYFFLSIVVCGERWSVRFYFNGALSMNIFGKQIIYWAVAAGILSISSGCATYKKNSYLVSTWERSHQKAGSNKSITPYFNAVVMTIPALCADAFLFPGMAMEAAGSAGAFDSAGEWAREEERKREEQEALNQAAYSYAVSQETGYDAAAHQRELDEKLEDQRIQGQIDAERRKDAALKAAQEREREQERQERQKELRWKLEDETDELKKAWSDFEFKLAMAGRDLKQAEFPGLESEYRTLESEQANLNERLEKAGMNKMSDQSNDTWFQINRRLLKNRASGTRKTLYGMHGSSGEEWSEHFVEEIQGIRFYQRVRFRTWPDAAVDLTWRVENTTRHPYWHSLTEFKTDTDPQHYLWGGSTLKPGASHSHVYVSYAEDRTSWKFEGFVRRED